MTPEITALTLAGLLQVLQFAVMSWLANMELGFGKTLSPRDPERLSKPLMEQVTTRTGRHIRAMNNHFEALILFTIAVVVVTWSDQANAFTALCAWTYLVARILYVPAYVLGWVPGRSLIFMAGLTATAFMYLAALL